MPTPRTPQSAEVIVKPIQTQTIRLAILGLKPLIINRMSEKAKHDLLLPGGRRRSDASRAESLKHDPMAEFLSSPYLLRGDDEPTYLAALSAWFKGAMLTAALDLPGTKKAQIGRNVWVEGERLPLYGVPELLMSVVRSAGIEKTPDIRTRTIVPRWAVTVDVTFVTPLLTERSIINLLAAAGMTSGVGDYRPEKGKGDFGQFIIVDPDDERFRALLETGGRAAQKAAMNHPAFYDEESEEKFSWFSETVKIRGREGQLRPLAAD